MTSKRLCIPICVLRFWLITFQAKYIYIKHPFLQSIYLLVFSLLYISILHLVFFIIIPSMLLHQPTTAVHHPRQLVAKSVQHGKNGSGTRLPPWLTLHSFNRSPHEGLTLHTNEAKQAAVEVWPSQGHTHTYSKYKPLNLVTIKLFCDGAIRWMTWMISVCSRRT